MKCTSDCCGRVLRSSVNPRTVCGQSCTGRFLCRETPRFQTVKFMSVITAAGGGGQGRAGWHGGWGK